MKDVKTLKAETHDAIEESRAAREAKNAATTTIQIAALIGGFCILLNVAFWFLSSIYFDDKRSNPLIQQTFDDAHITNVRLAFAVFTGLVSAMSIVVSVWPKWVAHALAASAGIIALVASLLAFKKGMPFVLPMSLFVMGALLPLLAWRSLLKSRAAWSFLIATCAVLALVLLFGAPKVRGQLGIGLWTALILPGLLGVATVGLAMIRGDYRERI